MSERTRTRRIQRIRARAKRAALLQRCSYCKHLYGKVFEEKTFRAQKCCPWCWAKFTGDRRIYCQCKSMNWAVCPEHPCSCGKGFMARPYHDKTCVHHLPYEYNAPETMYCRHCDLWTKTQRESTCHWDCWLDRPAFCQRCERLKTSCTCS